MSSHLNRGRFHLAWIAVLLAGGPAGSQETSRRAVLHVRLPANAQLTIDGRKTTQTGALRHFYSPPLERDKSYHYTFAWTYRTEGVAYQARKTVHVRAGDDREEDLRNEKGTEVKTGENEPEEKKKTEEPRKRREVEQDLDVKFVPTPPEVVEKMLQLARIKESDIVYDLGCGDGRILIAAAKKYKCKAVGVDLDEKRVREARANVKAAGLEKLITIEQGNLFDLNLKSATVVTLYLLPEINVKLLPQLKKLKDGSRIVSHDFEIEGYPPRETASVPVAGEPDHRVYLWETPLKQR